MRVLSATLISVLIAGAAASTEVEAASTQLIRVITSDWNAVDGILQRFEKSAPGKWKAIGPEIPVVVGKKGLGLGRGRPTDLESEISIPVKREGDGKGPAGIFELGTAFGYAEKPSMQLLLPYVQATPELHCVDDVKSPLYNQLVDTRHTPITWTSSEIMKREDELYRIGILVNHNLPAVSGAGSCIFLHIWVGPGRGTSGCTAMQENELVELMNWLDPAKEPLLVQFPIKSYAAVREKLELP